jgi:transketolase
LRTAFFETLAAIAAEDPRTCLLTGDLGYMAVEPFSERFPDRFINVGVAEQDMVGIATGMAEAGFVPYVYSIATFATLRPYEFIRNGPVVHQLPVRVVGVGGGMEYGTNGISHYSLDDLGVMRVQPGMTVIVPADPNQARHAVKSVHDLAGPVYIRLGKDDRQIVPGLDGRFTLGRCERILSGDDVIMVAAGPIATTAVAAAQKLASIGVSCAVAVVSTLAPACKNDLLDLLGKFRVAVSVEVHYTVGGLGSLLAETIAESGIDCRLIRSGVHEAPVKISGSQAAMERAYGLDAEGLFAVTHEAIKSFVAGAGQR